MIPTTDNLKEINPELTKALKNFPDLINQWEQKLRAITPYCAVMIPDANEYHDDMDDEKGAFGGFLGHTYDTEDLFTTSTVIAFQTMACIEQWLQEKIETDYPESISSNPSQEWPFNLEAKFNINNIATINLYGWNGSCIWSEKELQGNLSVTKFPETYTHNKYTGTWEEVYNHLVNLIDLVGAKTKIE